MFLCVHDPLPLIVQGTTYVYESFFRPYLSQHENDIDHSLLELRTRAGDMAVIYWQRVASYGQTRILEILQYVAAQSTPRPQPPQVRLKIRYKYHYLLHFPRESLNASMIEYILNNFIVFAFHILSYSYFCL